MIRFGYSLAIILGMGVMMLFDAPQVAASAPVVAGPLSGSISQGALTVALNHDEGCPGGIERTSNGTQACIARVKLRPGDIHLEQIPLLTPGSVHIHLSAPVRFLEAYQGDGSTEIKGSITQSDASDAKIKFDRHLVPGELTWLRLSYRGIEYGFSFVPANAITIKRASCSDSIAKVSVVARAKGVLSLGVRDLHERTPTDYMSRGVAVTGKQNLRLRLSSMPGALTHKGQCMVSVTLRNAFGSERVATLEKGRPA